MILWEDKTAYFGNVTNILFVTVERQFLQTLAFLLVTGDFEGSFGLTLAYISYLSQCYLFTFKM